jgi:hypothetical protein
MRTLGNILKRFFWSKKKQYWLCVPSEMESKKVKDLFIMDTLEFLSNKITIR